MCVADVYPYDGASCSTRPVGLVFIQFILINWILDQDNPPIQELYLEWTMFFLKILSTICSVVKLENDNANFLHRLVWKLSEK